MPEEIEYTSENIIPITIIEAIRKRPGMYIGDLHKAAVNVVAELLANVIDLHLVGKASQFQVKQNDGWIEVSDDGPGLPFDQVDQERGISIMEKHLTVGHDTPTADGHFPHVHLGLRGIGLILVNALSSTLEVSSCKNLVEYTQTFKDGVPVSAHTEQPTKANNGSTFRFQLSEKLFGEYKQLNLASMRSLLFFTSHQFPGLKISLQEECFLSKNGFRDFVETLLLSNEGVRVDIKSFSKSTDVCDINFACGTMSRSKNKFELSFANGVLTNEGGSHVKGMKKAFKKYGLKPNVAIVSVVLTRPVFAAPTKAKLYMPEVKTAVELAISEFLEQEISE